MVAAGQHIDLLQAIDTYRLKVMIKVEVLTKNRGSKDIEQIVYSYMDFVMAPNMVAYLEIANSFTPFCFNLTSVFIY